MSNERIAIKRYPNRRFYARTLSKYVSLQEIEALVMSGKTVEISDSQSGEDLTRTVLTQIIMDRHPEKMSLFPVDMLHCILRSNDAISELLRDYFRNSLTFLDYLQGRNAAAEALRQPMHWMKLWLDSITPDAFSGRGDSGDVPPSVGDSPADVASAEEVVAPEGETSDHELRQRLESLERRLSQLESEQD